MDKAIKMRKKDCFKCWGVLIPNIFSSSAGKFKIVCKDDKSHFFVFKMEV